MSLFQNSVINKYLQELNKQQIETAYKIFISNFGNPDKQNNIRASKEEQYQEGFLIDLFVNVLGYTKNPEPDFNLTTEYKNEKDAKKADGAILKENKPIAIIELKGTDTIDLDTVEIQAFNYKNNQSNCRYIITSNFEKLRFYIENAIEYEEFNLFNLSIERFSLLFLCLSKNKLLNDIPLTIKQASLTQEENITKKLYSDYSTFKHLIFSNIVELNPQHNKLLLYKKTQKFLDRFLFIFFAEDRLLLPPNSIREILKQWDQLKELDNYIPLYDRYKKYFNYLFVGHKGKEHEIFAYNGGLFEPDEILDNIKIDDEILYKHTGILADYDYQTEVDVNILGHIFEHSLGEIEEVQAKLEGQEIEKTKTRRKKDGIFYTPKYITKYIVDNTLGALCDEKKKELEINEDEFSYEKRKTKRKELIVKLDTYRNWLLKLTICDPACGSGAFLNQALNYLIEEHKIIDELQAKVSGASIIFPDIENKILENNLFGVDLNDESIEIAKLSLWLRTAHKGRKLTSLNKNIKCGNSLIDDPNIDIIKAFNWKKEFPEVFANGGFDVVFGNPPYVNANDLKKNLTNEQYDFLKTNYVTSKGTVDLYIYFFEKGLSLINKNGVLSYITPNRFLSASYGAALREYLIFNFKIESLIDYSDKNVFQDASTYPVITFIKNKTDHLYDIITGKFDDITKKLISEKFPSNKLNILDDYILGFLLNDKLEITEKIITLGESLSSVGKINATSTAKEADDYSTLINERDGLKLINTGTIDPYMNTWGFDYLTDKGRKYKTPFLPKIDDIISSNRISLYSSPKIIISKIGLRCEAFYDKNGEYASINTNCVHSFNHEYLPEYILCWLNSRLYNYSFECLFDGLRMSGGYLLFSAPNLKNTYIYKASIEKQKPFIEKANTMLARNEELQVSKAKFIKVLLSKYSELKISNKLKNWFDLDFNGFSKELEKEKIKLSLSERAEWVVYFEKEKAIAHEIISIIEKTNKEIDNMVYKLYDLSEEEIKIVEK